MSKSILGGVFSVDPSSKAGASANKRLSTHMARFESGLQSKSRKQIDADVARLRLRGNDGINAEIKEAQADGESEDFINYLRSKLK